MASSPTPINIIKNVQGNIKKFESLSLGESQHPKKENRPPNPSSTKAKRAILELKPTDDSEPLLKASKSYLTIQKTALQDIKAQSKDTHKRHDSTVFIEQSYLKKSVIQSASLSDNAREILRCQPCHEDLVAVLQYLQFGIDDQHEFNIRIVSPKAAQIVNVLVTSTIPDIWTNVKQRELSEDEAKIKKTIISSLKSATGIGALVAQIKILSTSHTNEVVLVDLISVLGDVLKGQKTVFDLLKDAQGLYAKEADRRLYWQEITTLLAGGRILSTVAQAFAAQNVLSDKLQSCSWLGDGIQFVRWLAANITSAAIRLNVSTEESWMQLGQLTKRGLSLGYRDTLVAELYTSLLLGQRAFWTPLHLILKHLTSYEQRSFFDSMLTNLAQNYLASAGGPAIAYSHDPNMQKVVAGVAAFVAGIVKHNEILEEHMEEWLSSSASKYATIGLSSRRALIAALGQSEEKLQRILEKALANFGDKLQIQHASILQQEATAQMILLIIGHLNRINANVLKYHSITTLLMQAVSNRLAASIPRSRLLGIIVGTAMSRLVDKQDSVIDFGVEEMETDDVKQWLGLVSVHDYIGTLADIQSPTYKPPKTAYSASEREPAGKTVRKKGVYQTSKIIAIEEISSSTDSEEDLVPYQKPDSDPEDSDEDPTLINRDKPSAPVYVIDLIKQLQTTEKPDIVSLALKSAPGLIRRKANFGTELSDNAQALVTTLVNLQEGMSDPDLQQLRLESLVSCIVARADLIVPSLADLYFRGDFSLAQRISILTAVGLATRELAGFKDDQTMSTTDTFPSKRLPTHLEPQPQQHLSATRNPVAMLTDTAAHAMVRPMALAAADKVTGPSVFKIRTFSSRMEVEKKSQERSAARTKMIPKNLYKLVTSSVYLPFCSRMSLLLSNAQASRSLNTTILHSSTLRLFLQTLTLVLHTLGPSASLHLPTLHHETLLLLLNLHSLSHLSTDPAVLPALLHLLLALLDITVEAGLTAQEHLMADYGAQVMELVNWSNSLGDKIGDSGGEGEDGVMSWPVLAAGIQVKWFEIGRRFQSRMLGLTMDEMDQLAGA